MKKESPSKKMLDRETTIEAGDGGAAAIVAGLLVVALVIVGLFFYFSLDHNTTAPIDITVPHSTAGANPPAAK